MSNYEVAELRWENGHVAMHGLAGLGPAAPGKSAWTRVGGTLESLVHQATQHKGNEYSGEHRQNLPCATPAKISGKDPTLPDSTKKRKRPESSPQGRQSGSCNGPGECMEDSAFRGNLGNPDEDPENQAEAERSLSTRRSRATAVHNQSERKRRDKINQKMKTLQKMVPNASKTDKASMLDEVIKYLKQLQAQLHMMSLGNMPQMMMPIGVQHHLQMSLLARMGMGVGLGMGMGMLDMNPVGRAAPQSVPPLLHPTPPFLMSPLMPTQATKPQNMGHTANSPNAMHNLYSAFLNQSMNVDIYNKMAELYGQQVNQPKQANAPLHVNLMPNNRE
eukprot:TRINITY_DN5578_c0_g3_i2.p1 TRINITY_DN5578_c0_g3~~TRINITY_DN5578_c0_g3_i2.p1  ORF type:complete len:333 (+),score=43.96 TRINITY_DN5578_c0_g3_i2:283-1281(+)